MDYLLNEKEVMVRDLCRQIAQEEVAPVAAEYDKLEKFPHEIMKILAQSDLFSIFVPSQYGGTLEL
ncbi:MAG: acyl-CoA dehydrogenase family protein, partial [Candidatus Omnitrophica bacterium]|nr:acyl-CoA dehydrogenase family protein [Candidatus Omnitrophota bacterium]